ncbi:MAG: TonB-dependent receptor, partial [Gemmatimonadota bacterium]|nr:TonB-dependent receptor [Gemmatimonadota bacterium]
SDAIAGVVNILLKSGEAEHVRTSYGQVLTAERGRQFRDGKIVDVNATYGAQFIRGGHVTLTAEVRDRDGTNRAYPDERQQYFTGDPRNAGPAVISSHEGDGKARDVGMFVNAMLPLSTETELYAFGGGMHRDGRAAGPTFRRPNEVRTVRAIHPEGFLSETESRILNFSGVAGARGRVRGWRWELSSAFGGNSVRYHVHNSNNVTLGTASPTDFYVGTLRSRQWTSNLDISRQVNLRAGTPINFGAGAEFRLDTYGIEAGEPDSYRDGGLLILDGDSVGKPGPVGSQGMLGFRPLDEVDATRNNVAAYVDIDGRIMRRLLLNVAGRTERYSDHGSNLDGKVAARLELLTGVALRAAAATGFRAPSLNQSYYSATRGILRLVSGVNTSFIIRTLPVGSQEAQILGATPLRPETSRNFSGGIVIDFPRLPTVTADYYAIDVDDRIVPSGEFVHPSVARLFEEHGLGGIAGGRYFTNAIDTKTRGVDIVMNYGMLVGGSGLLRLMGGYNKTKTRVTRVAAAPPQLAAFQSVLFNRAERGKMEVGQPRQTITLTANYSMNRIGLNVHNQRFGQASLPDLSDPLKDQTVRAKWITDAGVSYQLRPRLTVAASASNLFDVYPDEWWDFKDGVDAQGMSMFGIFRYPGGISPFGMNGRTAYVHLSYR